MRILVTGSTGLLGYAVAARCAASGHEVVGLARGAEHPEGLASKVQADISRPGLADALAGVGRCDAIVHCAVSRGGGEAEIERTNRLGTEQVLALASRWASERFIYLSGVTVIGRPRTLPITEEHPVKPQGAYLVSKLEGERLVAEASGKGMGAVSLRISAPIGVRMPADRMLAVFVRRALAGQPLAVAGRGSRRQDYVDARDVAAAVELTLAKPTSPLLNVAGGRSWGNLEVAQRCIALLGSESEVVHSGDDPQDDLAWDVSIERARAELGWEPEHDVDRVIEELAGAQRSAPAASERSGSSPPP